MSNSSHIWKNPSVLRSLQYFESVARHGSVKKAAEEHRISTSAISHQLRELREVLGEELLVRSGRGVELTDAGERLFQHVTILFSGFDSALEDVVGRRRPVIRLAVCSSFGPAWLANRLPEFLQLYPETDVEVRLYAQDPMQTEMVADAIVTADNVVSGFEAVTLFKEVLVAVASKDLAFTDKGMPLKLITTDLGRGNLADDWHEFSRTTGMDYVGMATQGLSRCTHYLMAMALAKSGVGAALVPDFLAADALRKGDLRLLSNARMPDGRVYRLCYKKSRAKDPALRLLSGWMRSRVKPSSNTGQVRLFG